MNSIRHSLVLLIAVAAAALLAAGCGGEASTDGYERGLRTVQGHLDDAAKASVDASGELDVDKRAAAIRDQEAALQRASSAAKKLDPPKQAAKAHGKFVRALSAYADLFEKLVAAKGDSAQEAQLFGEAGPIVDDLRAANVELEKAGFSATPSEDT